MDKKPRILISLCAILILVVASLGNVVGYHIFQTSQQNRIQERINQRELLFQTICDIAYNKEIQRIILKSQISRGIFLTSEFPVVTKKQIRQMYFIGLILSKVVSKSRIQSMIGKYQFNNQEMQKEISTVIEKNTILNTEITQLSNSECDCGNKNTLNRNYTGLCTLLFPLYVFLSLYTFIANIMFDILNLDRNNKLIFILYLFIIFPFVIIFEIGWRLDCFWGYDPYLPRG